MKFSQKRNKITCKSTKEIFRRKFPEALKKTLKEHCQGQNREWTRRKEELYNRLEPIRGRGFSGSRQWHLWTSFSAQKQVIILWPALHLQYASNQPCMMQRDAGSNSCITSSLPSMVSLPSTVQWSKRYFVGGVKPRVRDMGWVHKSQRMGSLPTPVV